MRHLVQAGSGATGPGGGAEGAVVDAWGTGQVQVRVDAAGNSDASMHDEDGAGDGVATWSEGAR